jgi:acetoacetate decarboxylase
MIKVKDFSTSSAESPNDVPEGVTRIEMYKTPEPVAQGLFTGPGQRTPRSSGGVVKVRDFVVEGEPVIADGRDFWSKSVELTLQDIGNFVSQVLLS